MKTKQSGRLQVKEAQKRSFSRLACVDLSSILDLLHFMPGKASRRITSSFMKIVTQLDFVIYNNWCLS